MMIKMNISVRASGGRNNDGARIGHHAGCSCCYGLAHESSHLLLTSLQMKSFFFFLVGNDWVESEMKVEKGVRKKLVHATFMI